MRSCTETMVVVASYLILVVFLPESAVAKLLISWSIFGSIARTLDQIIDFSSSAKKTKNLWQPPQAKSITRLASRREP